MGEPMYSISIIKMFSEENNLDNVFGEKEDKLCKMHKNVKNKKNKEKSEIWKNQENQRVIILGLRMEKKS